MRPLNRDDLLATVASLYYEQDYNQQQIAEQLNISRSNISRLLQEAKAKGIVEVRVHKPIHRCDELEAQFVRRFGIAQALILDSMGRGAGDLPLVGQIAARYLAETLRPGDTIAISWGTGVYSAVSALAPLPHLHTDVVQMLGGVGSQNSQIDGPELARRLAELLGGRYYYLHAPVLVDNPTVRDMLMAEASIQETLARVRGASLALVGIGSTVAGQCAFVRAGHLTEMQLGGLRAQGAVGEIGGQHFDIHGNPANISVNQRVISIELAALKRLPCVLAVACGLAKARSILAALRGGYISVLATDDLTARAVLAEADHAGLVALPARAAMEVLS